MISISCIIVQALAHISMRLRGVGGTGKGKGEKAKDIRAPLQLAGEAGEEQGEAAWRVAIGPTCSLSLGLLLIRLSVFI